MPIAEIIPRIATTTKSSIKVKPELLVVIKIFLLYSMVTEPDSKVAPLTSQEIISTFVPLSVTLV